MRDIDRFIFAFSACILIAVVALAWAYESVYAEFALGVAVGLIAIMQLHINARNEALRGKADKGAGALLILIVLIHFFYGYSDLLSGFSMGIILGIVLARQWIPATARHD